MQSCYHVIQMRSAAMLCVACMLLLACCWCPAGTTQPSICSSMHIPRNARQQNTMLPTIHPKRAAAAAAAAAAAFILLEASATTHTSPNL
jgi:hypothetical protein